MHSHLYAAFCGSIMHMWCFYLVVMASAVGAQLLTPPPPPPTSLTLDTRDLTSSLDRNVLAIGNLTASNEQTVAKLQTTVDKLVVSNDRNVGGIVNVTSQLISKWDAIDSLSASMNNLTELGSDALKKWDTSMQPSINGLAKIGSDALQKWDTSMQPSVNNITSLGRDALSKWDTSLKPSVDGIANLGRDALGRWDTSLKPSMDGALHTFNETILLIDGTIEYVKGTVVPLVFVFGSVWVGLCFVGCMAVAFRSFCFCNRYHMIPSAHPTPKPGWP